MRIFGLRTRVVEDVSGVLVLSMFAGCVVEEKKRNKHDDDCDSDLDCDEDEICDDGECEKQTSGSGGSSSNPSGGSAGSSSTPAGDLGWCRPRCEDQIASCPGISTQADCETGCVNEVGSAREYGCESSYKAFVDCSVASGACDEAGVEAACSSQINTFLTCVTGTAG